MAKLKVIKNFYDIEAKVDRVEGEEFTATDKRAKAINSTEFGQLVEVVKSAEKKASKESE